jgi:hypothetical protein
VVVIDGRELIGEQARRLFETQAGCDEKIGEQRVAQPVAIASAGAFRAVKGEAAQTDVAENAVVVHRDEPHIRSLGSAFIGVVARRSCPDAPMRRSPARRLNGASAISPGSYPSGRGDRGWRLPGSSLPRDPLIGVAAPPRAVIGGHIVAGRVPYRRAAGIEEAKPHRNVIGVGAQRMARADPR